jgi:hypothetical protein
MASGHCRLTIVTHSSKAVKMFDEGLKMSEKRTLSQSDSATLNRTGRILEEMASGHCRLTIVTHSSKAVKMFDEDLRMSEKRTNVTRRLGMSEKRTLSQSDSTTVTESAD